MNEKIYILLVTVIGLTLISLTANAMDYGTADEAKAMLDRAVKAIKQNKKTALYAFNHGDPMFKDRDLYVFCFDAETGEIYANGGNPTKVGGNVKVLKDKTGFPVGEELLKNAIDEKYRQIKYIWPRPPDKEIVPKTSYVTRVEDLGCGVGFYNQ